MEWGGETPDDPAAMESLCPGIDKCRVPQGRSPMAASCTARQRRVAFWQTVILLLLHKQICLAVVNSKKPNDATASATFSSVDGPLDPVQRSETTDVEDETGSFEEFDRDGGDEDDLVVYTEDSHDYVVRDANFEMNARRTRNSDDSGIIVVSTVDGTLAGLSRSTGQTLWKRTPGSTTTAADDDKTQQTDKPNVSVVWNPLITTTTTAASSSQMWRTAAVPSLLDGKVFLTSASTLGICKPDGQSKDETDCSETGEETVTALIRDLVDRAPFVDQRGRMYTAYSQSVAVAINLQTGEMVNTMTSPHHLNQVDLLKDYKEQRSEGVNNLLWMGRVDHTISVHEPITGALDVQFTTTELMSVNDMLLSSRGVRNQKQSSEPISESEIQHFLASQSSRFDSGAKVENGLVAQTAPRLQARVKHMIATPSGSVALLDDKTGEITWIAEESFDTPVAFALDSSTGLSLFVEFVPDAIMAYGSSEYVVRDKLKRQLEVGNDGDIPKPVSRTYDTTIFGSLPSSGQLFALPLGRQYSGASVTKLQAHPSSRASSALTTPEQLRHDQGISTSVTTNRNYFSEYHHGEGRSFANSCKPGSPFYPRCLTGSHDRRDALSSRLNNPHIFSDTAGSPFEPGANGAVVQFYHPEYGYRYIPPEQFYSLHHDFHNSRKRYKKLLGLFGSWLPALIAFIFVSSFELGRRKRQKTEIESVANGDATKGSVDAGIIQVDESVILGHGGHGTVVYKGLLDGRQVAVKRMLKTYNASADREISLLIESDGHPNVVRYFLKEARGDFVYLALELCDLSLHDLIGQIRQRLDLTLSENEKRAIFEASKLILYQIAKGTEHLHKLRIVHRDLKPANILLGDSRQQKVKQVPASKDVISRVFEKGGYVAKISDMGLGKQLVGQSSYGDGSLQSSLRGQTSRGQSSIIGVGPGSVGWQAPEVMALRMPSDASVKSDGSQYLNPSSEMSPIELSPSFRTSRAVDIFSLGCIFYSTLVPGSHPFGEWYEREANVMNNRPSIEKVKGISIEAHDLINAMLKRSPSARPTATQICEHPFFWSPERRMAFLCDFSDRLESDGTCAESTSFIKTLLVVEHDALNVVGTSWDLTLHPDLVNNVQRFRSYDPLSVRDLLRLIRNKHHHFDELPRRLREVIGSKAVGLIGYFEALFPRLLIHCFHACRELYPSGDELSVKYAIVSFGKTMKSPTTQALSRGKMKGEALPVLSGVASSVEGFDSVRVEATPVRDFTIPEGVSVERIESTCSDSTSDVDPTQLIVWYGSITAQVLNCRGWNRSDNEWQRRSDSSTVRRDSNLERCAEDPKFRTRLCNHWDESLGTICSMRKKNKCIFAHGPVELRVKEAKRNRWGKLTDANGDNNNPNHSGGEDTYGAALAIESERKQEGKWNTQKLPNQKGSKFKPAKRKQSSDLVVAVG